MTTLPDDAATDSRRPRWHVFVLAGVTALAYSNSLYADFVFDDAKHIVRGEWITPFWPPWNYLTDNTRPFFYATLAVQRALMGTDPFSYHLVNLLVHVLTGLVLYALVRRVLSLDGMPERYRQRAPTLAFAISLLWMVHPLQTESVVYVFQRVEMLMSLCILLVLYGLLRTATEAGGRFWPGFTVVVCAFGMGVKEVMVVAPVLALLFDRTFLAGSFRNVLRQRWTLHAALFACWSVLGLLLATAYEYQRSTGAGFGGNAADPLTYFVTQFSVWFQYLRLSIWPHPLCFDYQWPLTRSLTAFLPTGLPLLLLLALIVWALVRRPRWGFLGAWFFVILSPTSSIMPMPDPAVEHRMYLALAGVMTAAVLAVVEAGTRWGGGIPDVRRKAGWGGLLLIVTAFALLTFQRNFVYSGEASLWGDTLQKAPHNLRARMNYALALAEQGRLSEAEAQLRRLLEQEPDFRTARYYLGSVLHDQGKLREAIRWYDTELKRNPNFAPARERMREARRQLLRR